MKKILPLIIAGITVLTSCSFFSSSYDEKLVKTLEDGNSNAFIDGGVGRDNGDEDERIIVNPPKDVEPQEEPHEEPKEEPKVEPKIEDDIVYTITFEDGSGKVLQQDYVPAGLTPFYEGALPTKSSSQYYKHYVFKGWVPEIAPASKDQVYKANFSEVYYNYTVRFFDDDESTLLSSTEYVYGDVVKKPKNPTKARTVSSSYVFSGWRTKNSKTVLSTIPTVTNDADYYAVYTSTTNKYRITFKHEDGTILQEEDYEYGKTPTYKMPTPTKAKTASQEFVFTGWKPNISTVKGDETYVATFNSNNRQYAVRFLNDDGSLLKTVYVNYGYTPSYGGTPTKAATAQYKYTFSKWIPDVQPYSENGPQEYKASYTSTKQTYSVKFRNATNTGDLQSSTLEYGKTPSYTGSKPTKAQTETSTTTTTYTFIGWHTDDKATSALSALPTVTKNLVFYPIFSSYTETKKTFELKYKIFNAHLKEHVDLLDSKYNDIRGFINWEFESGVARDVAWVENGILIMYKEGETSLYAKLGGISRRIQINVYKLTLKTRLNSHTIRTRYGLVANDIPFDYTLQIQHIYWDKLMYFENGEKLTYPISLSNSVIASNRSWMDYSIRSESFKMKSGSNTTVDFHINQYDIHNGRRCFTINNDVRSTWDIKGNDVSEDRHVDIVVNFRSPMYPQYKANGDQITMDYRIWLSENTSGYYVKNPSTVFE